MFVFIRAVIVASLFISVVLVYVPGRLLSGSAIHRPATIGMPQAAGILIGAVGGAVVVWCVWAFASIGRGTPFPLDAPRKLVIRGPYRFVRNPMYIGAVLVLAGTAIFYGSWMLLGYAGFFFLASHLLVVAYEEPTLRQSFGEDYEAYCRKPRRWIPGPCER